MKNTLLLLLFLCFGGVLCAQDADSLNRTHQWEVGLLGGADLNYRNVNLLYASDVANEELLGFTYGVTGTYLINPNIALRCDLALIDKNFSVSRITQGYNSMNYFRRNKYLQLPVMAEFSFGGRYLRGYIAQGFYVGYWCMGTVEGASAVFDDGLGENSVQIKENYEFLSERDNRFEFGYASAWGLSGYIFRNVRLGLEYSLYYGLTSTKREYMNVDFPEYYTTHAITLRAAYCF